jgi:hypothetical protein
MQNMTAHTSAGSGVGTSSWFVIGYSRRQLFANAAIAASRVAA